MSYSFSVKAANKEEALAKVKQEFDKVVEGQPIHAHDQTAAITAASEIINVLADAPDGLYVTVNGYVSWTEPEHIIQASVQVSAKLESV